MGAYDVVIAGGGISGLSALHFVRQLKPELNVHLFEADSRLGGTIGTDHEDGYSFDWGPNGFLDREPLTLQFCEEVGLNDQIERASANVSNRFILRKGKLRSVPMSPPAFLTSDILSLSGRLRVMMEPFARGPKDEDESIYEFVRRRIGRQAADYLVQPMVSGIYGGLADRLSLESCFPIMKEMEDEYGSLFKAMIAKAKQAKAKGKKSGGPSGPGGWLTSFNGGLNKLVERCEQVYSEFITTGNGISSVEKNSDGYQVKFEYGEAITARHVVLAVPSYCAAGIVTDLCQPLSNALKKIPYAPISVVCQGYSEGDVGRKLDGFGFLVPSKEGRRILGSIWTSSIFSNRAPDGFVQLRTMVGGDGDHESMQLSDEELVDCVNKDLDGILGLTGVAAKVKLYRWQYGIPQFKIGHKKIMAEIEQHLQDQPSLHISGNAYYGIGLNDCVKQSYRVVEKI
jgi:oxygen-dependent protoporphyrinogen oxidase